jgi:predicted DNA-binding protein YlxM (UPF0122 family)
MEKNGLFFILIGVDFMEYSVKELAEQVGVSKQAIIDKIKKLGLQNDLSRKGNKFMISENQASLIKSAFQGKGQAQSQSNFTKQNSDLLYDIVKTLQSQLEEKDKQIAYYQEENRRLSDMATQSQALHAGTIQTQLLADDNTKTEKQGFLGKIFGRSKE